MSEQCTEASRATATYGRRGRVPPVLLFNTALTVLSVIFKIEKKKSTTKYATQALLNLGLTLAITRTCSVWGLQSCPVRHNQRPFCQCNAAQVRPIGGPGNTKHNQCALALRLTLPVRASPALQCSSSPAAHLLRAALPGRAPGCTQTGVCLLPVCSHEVLNLPGGRQNKEDPMS